MVWDPVTSDRPRPRIRQFTDWVEATRGVAAPNYEALRRWSVEDDGRFWEAIWDYFAVGSRQEDVPARSADPMPHQQWFPGSTLNFAEYLLAQGSSDDVAVIGVDETGREQRLTRAALRRQVRAFAGHLTGLGVGAGDVVAGYLPHTPEAVVALLATTSLGAVWCSVGQDYESPAVIARLGQLEPVVLIAADGYRFAGRNHSRRDELTNISRALRTVRDVVLVHRLDSAPLSGTTPWSHALQAAPVTGIPVPFDHPLWVLFSSGTTGLPKGLVHGHGGILLETVKQMGLHWDLSGSDVVLWHTSPSWVMWNLLVSTLATGAAIVCYDGSPTWPDASRLWQLVERLGVTYFGSSPGLLGAARRAGVRPGKEFDLSSLRSMGSTGSPLPGDLHRWVSDEVGPLPLWSISGGTDICGAFVGGSPDLPVWSGELSARCLGVALEAWSDEGHPVIGEVGEMVITQPLPSMPLRLWGDEDGSRYAETYLSAFPGVWRQGDWITISERGSVVIHGRSDSTLNRNGIRMGSADIYAAVESMPEVTEAVVLGIEEPDGGYWMPLFVCLAAPGTIDEDLVRRIAARIRAQASPRHAPDAVFEVEGIPHTRTGKKLEVPLKRLFLGADPAVIFNPDTIDNPALVDAFAAHANAYRADLIRRSTSVTTR
ncbi:acetoacetate--CoA ligase [Cryptosporangium sp. NPDC051539]|uniref:acetoacetate--CoA ligase n=1 Tax=Cryptosporangium sp. NPDC051539 TaxID=3363962 RepID=UPI0037AD987C